MSMRGSRHHSKLLGNSGSFTYLGFSGSPGLFAGTRARRDRRCSAKSPFCEHFRPGNLVNQNKNNNSRPHPPTPNAFCTAPTEREVIVVKPFDSFVRDTRAHGTAFPVSIPNYQTEFLTFLRSPSPLPVLFLPRAPRSPGCFSARDFAHAGGPVR
jgi:hypothetical protein